MISAILRSNHNFLKTAQMKIGENLKKRIYFTNFTLINKNYIYINSYKRHIKASNFELNEFIKSLVSNKKRQIDIFQNQSDTCTINII